MSNHGSTDRLHLPFPYLPAPADVPYDFRELVDRLEALATDAWFMPGDLKITAALEPTAGWLFCDGREVERSAHADLFSAIGEAYGRGDGELTFNLPDFRGRVPMGSGVGGPNMTRRVAGERLGSETHSHRVPSMSLQAGVLPHRHGLSTARTAQHRHGLTEARVNIPRLTVDAHRHTLNEGRGFAWVTIYSRAGGEVHWIINMRRSSPPEAFPPEGQGQPGGFDISARPMPGIKVDSFGGNEWPFPANLPGSSAGGSGVAYLGGVTDATTRNWNHQGVPLQTQPNTATIAGSTDDGVGQLTGETDEGTATISGNAQPTQTDAQPSAPPAQVINVFIKT